MDTKPTK